MISHSMYIWSICTIFKAYRYVLDQFGNLVVLLKTSFSSFAEFMKLGNKEKNSEMNTVESVESNIDQKRGRNSRR